MLKVEELRNLNETDLNDKLNNLSEDLAKLLYQKRMGQVDKPHQFKQIRKDISRVKTIIREKQIEQKKQK